MTVIQSGIKDLACPECGHKNEWFNYCIIRWSGPQTFSEALLQVCSFGTVTYERYKCMVAAVSLREISMTRSDLIIAVARHEPDELISKMHGKIENVYAFLFEMEAVEKKDAFSELVLELARRLREALEVK